MNWVTSQDRNRADRVTVTVTDRAQLFADLDTAFEAGGGISLATLNLDHVVKLRQNPAFAEAYARHSHVSADGRPVLWLSRLAGQKVDLVTGADLIEPLAAWAARRGAPMALVGSTHEILTQAADRLKERFDGLQIAACIAPSMTFDPNGAEAQEVLARIEASGARLVVLALGAPRQECLAPLVRARLPAASVFSLGAAVDFVAGAQKRAPGWVRRLALEWLWRLMSNPARLARRYAACLLILPQLTFKALLRRRRKPAS